MEALALKPAFWRGRRVLVTGHTGFKGAWLALWLRELGAEVTGIALPPPEGSPSLFALARVAEGMRSLVGDVRDAAAMAQAMHGNEIVIHMAAQSLVRRSYEDPVETFATNVMGTVSLLEAARGESGVRAVVVVTSDKCYENREWLWGYRENDPLGGHDPYSSSKACAELVTASYRRSFFGSGCAVASARAGNVIGGGDWAADRLVPDLVMAFAQRRPAAVRNPVAVRPWQHVLDPLHGYLLLAERLFERPGEFAEAWNFGPDDADARTVEWVATRLARRWGDGARWQVTGGDQPHEAGRLQLDCSRARARLGWRPRLALGSALDWTVDWYRANAAGADARELTLDQIRRFGGADTAAGGES